MQYSGYNYIVTTSTKQLCWLQIATVKVPVFMHKHHTLSSELSLLEKTNARGTCLTNHSHVLAIHVNKLIGGINAAGLYCNLGRFPDFSQHLFDI